MTIDHYSKESIELRWTGLLKSSHRTRPEQWVGFAILMLICLAFELLNGKLIQQSLSDQWYQNLIQASWSLSEKVHSPIWTVYFLLLSISFWTLWRRRSLRRLKLEASVYASQFLLQLAWSLSFFILQETLLALVALLLLWCDHLLCALLFWKKERISSLLLIPPFLWIFYAMALNMVICICNP